MTQASASEQHRGLKILAKSVYRQLKSSGYSTSEMVSFTSELLGLMTQEAPQELSHADEDAS